MKVLNKGSFVAFVFIYVVLWIVFIIQENKPGQHTHMAYLYRHNNYEDKISYIIGGDFYDFLMFCKDVIPGEAAYNISGFRASDIKEVQAMYYLWPLKRVSEDADFKIFYDCELEKIKGYKLFKKYKDTGFILAKEGEK